MRRARSAIRFYRELKRLPADCLLALNHVFDLARLYLTRPNDELAYYNLLFSIALSARPTTIVELGTGPGLSSLAFVRVLKYMRRAGWARQAVLHSCDINPALLGRLKRFGDMVIPHPISTDQLAEEWAREPIAIDFLYIDADHSHTQSLADFEHFAKWVVPNGLILMHDTFPRSETEESTRASGTVWQTAQYIKNKLSTEYEIATIPYLAGVSIIRKKGAKYF